MNKKLFLFVAATAALASCSDELSLNQEAMGTVDGINGKLVEAGLLAGVRSDVDATRAYTPLGSFVWMSEKVDGASGDVAKADLPKVGLCWTGVGVDEEGNKVGAIDVAEQNVFTNYLYEQIGWIKQGDTVLDWDECSGKVYNGAFYTNWAGTLNEKAHFAGSGVYATGSTLRSNKYYYGDAGHKVTGEFTYEGGNKPLNLGNGIFTTENSSVFMGQYLVYFPYNDSFKKGPIMANVKDHFNVDVTDDIYATISSNAFQLGLIEDYKGIKAKQGKEANFTAKNYSSVANIKLYITSGPVTRNVKSVILYSPEYGIDYTAGINAKSAVDAIHANDMTKVAQVDGTQKHVHAVYADLETSASSWKYAQIKQVNNYSVASAQKIALPVLPQTVKDLQVIVVYDDYSTAYKTFGSTEFKAGDATELALDLGKLTDSDYLAYDEVSLVNVLGQIKGLGGDVRILRPIDLGVDANEDGIDDNKALYATKFGAGNGEIRYSKDIKVYADASADGCKNANKCDNKASLVIKSIYSPTATAEQVIRSIESEAAGATFTIDVPVTVEGYGCCAPHAAVLNLGGKNTSAVDKITLTKTLTNYGTTNVGNTAGLTEINLADVENIRDTKYVQAQVSKNGKTYTKGSFDRKDILAITVPVVPEAAKLNFLAPGGNQQKTTVGNIKNEGSVVFSAVSKFTTGDSDGNRANFVTVESITNKGFLTVGKSKATAETDIAGGDVVVKAFALVHVNANIVNTEKYAYIHTEVEVPGEARSATTDGRLDVYNAGTTSSNSGTIENHGVINLLGATHLQNQEKGLFIDRVNGQVGGLYVENGTKLNAAATDADYNEIYYRGIEAAAGKYSTDVKPGIYCTEVNTPARLAKVLKDPVQQKSCVVIDIIDNPTLPVSPLDPAVDPETYDFAANAELKALTAAQLNVLKDKDVRFSNPTIIKNSNKTGAKYDKTTEIGHCIDVKANVTLDEGNAYNVYNNVLVREGAVLDMTANAAVLHVGDVEPDAKGKNVYVFGNGQFQSVPAVGSFVSTPQLYVGHNLVVKAATGIVNLGDGATTATNNRELYVVWDVNNSGKVYSDKKFYIGNDYVGAAGSNLDSDGNDNIVKHNFELSGDAQFAPNTTTTIEDTFNSNAKPSVFTREELGGDPDSRSTVNCYTLGKTEGHAVGGWPTQYGDM